MLNLGPKPYNVISLPTNGEVAIFLTWDDRSGRSANNYDLFLVKQSNGQLVARSADVQSGAQDPVEIVDYANTGANDFFQIVVQNVHDQAQAKHLNLFSFSAGVRVGRPAAARRGAPRAAQLQHRDTQHGGAERRGRHAGQRDLGGRDLLGLCRRRRACSPAAPAPDESCDDRSNSTVEFFSSQGPTIDGRTKPDISGIDGVSGHGRGEFRDAVLRDVGGGAARGRHRGACRCRRRRACSAERPARLPATTRAPSCGDCSSTTPCGWDRALPNNTFGYGRADALRRWRTHVPGSPAARRSPSAATTPSGAGVSGGRSGSGSERLSDQQLSNWSGGCGTGPAAPLSVPIRREQREGQREQQRRTLLVDARREDHRHQLRRGRVAGVESCLNGGATLFFTTLILVRLPTLSLPSLRVSMRRTSSLIEA